MYTWFRTFNAKVGHMPEALALCREAADYLKKKYDLDVELYTQLGGDPMKIGFLGRYETLGHLGDLEAAAATDEEWAALVKRASGLIEEGTVADQFWKKL